MIEKKTLHQDQRLDMKIPEIEYLISMSKYFEVEHGKETHLLWILRLADDMPLPPSWIEKIGMELSSFWIKSYLMIILASKEQGLSTLKLYKEIKSDKHLPYHPSTPFIFDFISTMRTFYKLHPEAIKVTEFTDSNAPK